MEQDTRVWVYILIWNVNVLLKYNVVSLPALAKGLGVICIMEKMTQYSEFGCIFLQNYAFKISHFLHIAKDITSSPFLK